MNDIFKLNIKIINLRFPDIYKELEHVDVDNSYLKNEPSKNGDYYVPVLANGTIAHSKYSHIRESEKMFDGTERTILFCGIGAGYHIQYFLENFPNNKVFICEATYSSLKRLMELCDLSSILSNKNVVLLPPVQSDEFVNCFTQNYIPILMGDITIQYLRPWVNYFFPSANSLLEKKNTGCVGYIKTGCFNSM